MVATFDLVGWRIMAFMELLYDTELADENFDECMAQMAGLEWYWESFDGRFRGLSLPMVEMFVVRGFDWSSIFSWTGFFALQSTTCLSCWLMPLPSIAVCFPFSLLHKQKLARFFTTSCLLPWREVGWYGVVA